MNVIISNMNLFIITFFFWFFFWVQLISLKDWRHPEHHHLPVSAMFWTCPHQQVDYPALVAVPQPQGLHCHQDLEYRPPFPPLLGEEWDGTRNINLPRPGRDTWGRTNIRI